MQATDNLSLFQDKFLRKIVVGSAGLALAFMFASLAAIQIGSSNGLQFRWHWTIVLWMIAAALWNARFWKALWKIQETPTPQMRTKVKRYIWMLVALGIGAFLYPTRFIAETYRPDIVRGLVTAAIFLSTLVWMIFKFGRGFVNADTVELERLDQKSLS